MKANFLLILLLLPLSVSAWKIEPIVTDTDKKLINKYSVLSLFPPRINWEFLQIKMGTFGSALFGAPLHEAITLAALGCEDADPAVCFANRAKYADNIDALLAGVQWNDNPPFMLDKSGFTYADGTQASKNCLNDTIRVPRLPLCWKRAMDDAKAIAQQLNERAKTAPDSIETIGAKHPILYRSHYGDLQFLHAMSTDGLSNADTQRRMLVWAQFAYKVAIGQIKPYTPLHLVEVDGFAALMNIRDKPVDVLFALGEPSFRKNPADIPNFALGTLLHMLQDSFSDAHAERGEEAGACAFSTDFRQPGLINGFRSYALQDDAKHGQADQLEPYLAHVNKVEINAVSVSKTVIAFKNTKADWDAVVKPYIECALTIAPGKENDLPQAGQNYEK